MGHVLEIEHVTKRYPGVLALNDVSLSFERGEIHALMGENGAGKSTLIKMIAGADKPDAGKVIIDGHQYTALTPIQARNEGIGVIYQEFNLVPSLSIAENIFLGEKVGDRRFTPNKKEMLERSEKVMRELGLKMSPGTQVQMLSSAQQQLVEIAKAMVKDCKVLIMDEPTAAIAVAEVENMFRIVKKLKEQGVAIIYISHRIEEVFGLCDRVSILRDGCYVTTKDIHDVTRKDLIRYMVGRELNEKYPERCVSLGEKVLDVKKLTGNGDFDIDISLHKGEILGVAGLVGAGRTELAKMLCGEVKPKSGDIWVKGKTKRFSSVEKAVEQGIGLIPEDRKNEGLFMDFSIEWNIPSMSFKRISRMGVVDRKEAKRLTEDYTRRLDIKTPSVKQFPRNLSGGNQQKVVLAKVLAGQADILIFDEPTRGIDVGAKQEIYKLMNSLVESGSSIIMITSEMEELLGMSDRIIVLHEGRVTGELDKEDFSQNRVLELASGM